MTGATASHTSAGFTAIEILIAMSIIGILGGIVTPFMQRSIKRGALNESVALVEQAHRYALDAAQYAAIRDLGNGPWQAQYISLDITAHGVRVHATHGGTYASPLPYDDAQTTAADVIFSKDFPAGATAHALDVNGEPLDETVTLYYCLNPSSGVGTGFCDSDSDSGLTADPTPTQCALGLGTRAFQRFLRFHHNGRLSTDGSQ